MSRTRQTKGRRQYSWNACFEVWTWWQDWSSDNFNGQHKVEKKKSNPRENATAVSTDPTNFKKLSLRRKETKVHVVFSRTRLYLVQPNFKKLSLRRKETKVHVVFSRPVEGRKRQFCTPPPPKYCSHKICPVPILFHFCQYIFYKDGQIANRSYKASPWDNGSKEPCARTQRPRPDSNRGPFDPKSDAVTDRPLRLFSYFSLETGLSEIIFILSMASNPNDVDIRRPQNKKKYSFGITQLPHAHRRFSCN